MRHLLLLQVFSIILQHVKMKGPNKSHFETESDKLNTMTNFVHEQLQSAAKASSNAQPQETTKTQNNTRKSNTYS